MNYRFHHVHLLCSDLEKSIDFFTNTLGAVLVTRKKFGGAPGASLDLEGTQINLRIAAEGETVKPNASLPFYGYHHLCLQVADVAAAYSELSRKGFHFVKTPADTADSRTAFFKGPDNITIELLQPKE